MDSISPLLPLKKTVRKSIRKNLHSISPLLPLKKTVRKSSRKNCTAFPPYYRSEKGSENRVRRQSTIMYSAIVMWPTTPYKDKEKDTTLFFCTHGRGRQKWGGIGGWCCCSLGVVLGGGVLGFSLLFPPGNTVLHCVTGGA